MKPKEVVGGLPASARLIDIYHHDALDQNVQFKVGADFNGQDGINT